MALENYVKFLRGTPAAYSALTTKDNDTLYFISEVGASTGTLYLGSKQITGGTIDGSELKLGDLQDILLHEDLPTDAILMWNGTKWESVSLSSVISVMKGATASEDGVAGLVPVASAGQQEYFLRGDGTWADVGVSSLNTEVSELKNVVGTAAVKDEAGNITTPASGLYAELENKADASTVSALQTEVSTLSTTVGTLVGEDSNKSVRAIATEVLTEALIPENASESLDTLQEIAAWIQDHPEDAAEMNRAIQANTNSINTLNSSVGTLSTTVETLGGKVSALETAVGNLGDTYVTLTKYNSEVGDITKLYSTIVNEETQEEEVVSTTITDEILALQDAMKWHEM